MKDGDAHKIGIMMMSSDDNYHNCAAWCWQS